MTRHDLFLARALIVIGLLSSFLLPVGATAQTLGGSIAGVVRDTTGAVMPGVTVEASSPALIEKTVTAVSDGQGNYRIPELRPGIYTVTFTLPGFSVVRREGLELTSGFTATVNAELRVGGLEETVTVAGASPVVDVQNIRTQNVFSRDLLDTLPVNRSPAGYAALTLGAVLNNLQNNNVGGSQNEAAPGAGFSVHGARQSDQRLLWDGMQATDASFLGSIWSTPVNQVAAQETTYQLAGMGAEATSGGIQINIVPKEGGNTFTYYFNGNGTASKLQFDNLSDQIKTRGLTRVPGLKKAWDFGGAVGGPIKRDKLWFYFSSRDWGSQNYIPGNYFNKTHGIYLGDQTRSGASVYTPDLDRPAHTDGRLTEHGQVRITWQATQKSKFNFSQNHQHVCDCYDGITGLTAPEAVPARIADHSWLTQGKWNYPASNRLFIEAGATWVMYWSITGRQPEVTRRDIAMLETAGWNRGSYIIPAGFQWGAAVSPTTNYAPPHKLFTQVNQRVVTSYITGSHAFKAGVTTMEGWNRDRTEQNDPPIRIRLRGGVPIGIDEYMELENMQRLGLDLGAFAQDQWTVSRLTLNLGIRYNYFNAFVPAQTLRAPLNDGTKIIPEGRTSMFMAPEFGPHGTVFPKVDHVPQWKDWTPVIGAAYDVFGNGKTAIKSSLARYVASEGLTGIPRFNHPGRRLANFATRNWTDTNGNWFPDCDLPNPLLNGECGQISNLNLGKLVTSTTYADDVIHSHRGYNWQGALSVQQELRSGFALNVGYFRTWYGNLTVTANTALTAADFDSYCVTAPTDARLGETSGQQICGFHDVKPRSFGTVNSVITQAANFGKQTEVFDGVDISVNGRYGRGGFIQGGVSFGRTVTDNCDVLANNPQIGDNPYIRGGATDAYCHKVNSNQKQVKVAGNYPIPFWGLEASATYQNIPGLAVTATRVYSRAEILPSLGRNLNIANVTLPVMLPFSEFGDRLSQLDLRFGKKITLGRARIRGQFDIYNVFNASTILAQTGDYGVTGATWQRPTAILTARLLKFGVQFEY